MASYVVRDREIAGCHSLAPPMVCARSVSSVRDRTQLLGSPATVWTIGHSTHPIEEFLGLRVRARIKVIADSSPCGSRVLHRRPRSADRREPFVHLQFVNHQCRKEAQMNLHTAVRDETDRIADLYQLIDDVKTAMLTTVDRDGSLVSRPMTTQERRDGVDLWFMTTTDAHTIEGIRHQPEVNVMYYKDRTKDWVSASGVATLTQDLERIRELYKKDWKLWLGDDGGDCDGGPEDPRIVLIEVNVHTVNYFKPYDSRPVQLLKIAKAALTGAKPDLGEVRHLDASELRRAESG